MNTAQVLVALLKEYGVEYAFGVPGDTSMALYDVLHAARGEITHVLARDERGASFMADAYARLAYKPGVTEAPSVSSRDISALVRQRTPPLLGERAAPFWAEVAERAACNDIPMAPQRVIDTLWRHTPGDVVVVADAGTMTPFTAAQFRTRRAGRSIVIPRAHGGLGYALPATVGATFARLSERVVGQVGDGSFGMSGMELATIASLRLPIAIILFNNGSFGWIKMLQRLCYGERYLGVDFTGKMDAVAIAEAFGIRGVRITHPDQLGPTITEAMQSNEPTFIDVPTKSELEEVQPVHAWQAALQEESTPNRSR